MDMLVSFLIVIFVARARFLWGAPFYMNSWRGNITQLVEYETFNFGVMGSNPIVPTNLIYEV